MVWRCPAEQNQPLTPRIGRRYFGMVATPRTTLNSALTNAGENLGLRTALAPEPVTGLVPLIGLSFSTPLTSQPNAFCRTPSTTAGFLHCMKTPVLSGTQDLVTHAGE